MALHAMTLLSSEPEGALTTATLARRLRRSRAHLAKVLARLVRTGLLHSVRGPKGGFVLARPAAETTLLDVLVALEGSPEGKVGCPEDPGSCDGTCVLGRTLSDANRLLLDRLGDTSLREAARPSRHRTSASGTPRG